MSSHFLLTFIKSLENRGYSVEGTENMFQKIGEFEKLKFKKSGVIYKRFLRQTQGTKEKVQKIGEFEQSHVRKIEVQL